MKRISLQLAFIVVPCLVAAAFGMQIRSEETATEICVIEDKDLNEASGMAICRSNPEFIWLHNDSGDSARLFLIDRKGETVAIVTLDDVSPFDWEDMSSFTLDGEHWLLIADTGDNSRARTSRKNPCRLLLVREPKITSLTGNKNEKVQKIKTSVTATIELTYPNGPEDCESIAVDSVRREVLLVTKSGLVDCQLLKADLVTLPGRHKVTLHEIGKPGVPFATAMDVSPDGQRMLIASMFVGAVLERGASESWEDAARRGASVIKLPARRQGETACFDVDPAFCLFGSEGQRQPIWRVELSHAQAANN